MIDVHIRFHAELNDFLSAEQKNQHIPVTLNNHPAVKDTIESLGIPHTQVNVILVNGISVAFTYQLQTGDQVDVYPFHHSPDGKQLIHLQPPLSRVLKFVLDTHLGKLASYLRMLGFDTLYRSDFSDDDLAEISEHEDRYLLTRDRGLLKRNIVSRGYHLGSTNPREQLSEVVQRFELIDRIRPFRRCIACNGKLSPVEKEAIQERLEPNTRRYYDDFFICNQCGNIYWRGSHYQRMQQFVQQVLTANSA
ncbi:MAG TPA: Mut7-C RNAse domain-containing protein [Anaerolineales bacterium]